MFVDLRQSSVGVGYEAGRDPVQDGGERERDVNRDGDAGPGQGPADDHGQCERLRRPPRPLSGHRL